MSLQGSRLFATGSRRNRSACRRCEGPYRLPRFCCSRWPREIQSCQLALRKSSDASVQAFAKRMITDHKSLNAKIESLAKRKGYSLPSGISITQEATEAALKPLTGHAFDKVFMEHNVSDHKDDVKQFSDEAQHASDPDVRALAVSATPLLQEHLKLAEETRAKINK